MCNVLFLLAVYSVFKETRVYAGCPRRVADHPVDRGIVGHPVIYFEVTTTGITLNGIFIKQKSPRDFHSKNLLHNPDLLSARKKSHNGASSPDARVSSVTCRGSEHSRQDLGCNGTRGFLLYPSRMLCRFETVSLGKNSGENY